MCNPMRPDNSFPVILLAFTVFPAFANERLSGGFNLLIVGGLAIAVMARQLFELGALGGFVTQPSRRSGDSDLESFDLMSGLFCSPFGGGG